MSMRNDLIDDQLSVLRDRYSRLEIQLADIEFNKQACLNEFMKIISNTILLDFPFDASFFSSLVNKEHPEHAKNKKLIASKLKSTISVDIKIIDDFISCGLNMYRVTVPFTLHSNAYRLTIPVIENIREEDVVCHTFYNQSYIDWNANKLTLLRENGNMWELFWSGYSLHDENIKSLFNDIEAQ